MRNQSMINSINTVKDIFEYMNSIVAYTLPTHNIADLSCNMHCFKQKDAQAFRLGSICLYMI